MPKDNFRPQKRKVNPFLRRDKPDHNSSYYSIYDERYEDDPQVEVFLDMIRQGKNIMGTKNFAR